MVASVHKEGSVNWIFLNEKGEITQSGRFDNSSGEYTIENLNKWLFPNHAKKAVVIGEVEGESNVFAPLKMSATDLKVTDEYGARGGKHKGYNITMQEKGEINGKPLYAPFTVLSLKML